MNIYALYLIICWYSTVLSRTHGRDIRFRNSFTSPRTTSLDDFKIRNLYDFHPEDKNDSLIRRKHFFKRNFRVPKKILEYVNIEHSIRQSPNYDSKDQLRKPLSMKVAKHLVKVTSALQSKPSNLENTTKDNFSPVNPKFSHSIEIIPIDETEHTSENSELDEFGLGTDLKSARTENVSDLEKLDAKFNSESKEEEYFASVASSELESKDLKIKLVKEGEYEIIVKPKFNHTINISSGKENNSKNINNGQQSVQIKDVFKIDESINSEPETIDTHEETKSENEFDSNEFDADVAKTEREFHIDETTNLNRNSFDLDEATNIETYSLDPDEAIHSKHYSVDLDKASDSEMDIFNSDEDSNSEQDASNFHKTINNKTFNEDDIVLSEKDSFDLDETTDSEQDSVDLEEATNSQGDTFGSDVARDYEQDTFDTDKAPDSEQHTSDFNKAINSENAFDEENVISEKAPFDFDEATESNESIHSDETTDSKQDTFGIDETQNSELDINEATDSELDTFKDEGPISEKNPFNTDEVINDENDFDKDNVISEKDSFEFDESTESDESIDLEETIDSKQNTLGIDEEISFEIDEATDSKLDPFETDEDLNSDKDPFNTHKTINNENDFNEDEIIFEKDSFITDGTTEFEEEPIDSDEVINSKQDSFDINEVQNSEQNNTSHTGEVTDSETDSFDSDEAPDSELNIFHISEAPDSEHSSIETGEAPNSQRDTFNTDEVSNSEQDPLKTGENTNAEKNSFDTDTTIDNESDFNGDESINFEEDSFNPNTDINEENMSVTEAGMEIRTEDNQKSAFNDDLDGSGEDSFRSDDFENQTVNKSGRVLSGFFARHSPNCTTPKGEPGQCRRITQCLLSDALNNFNVFLQHLCLLRGALVGVCCPDNPVIEITDSEANATNSTETDIKQPPEGCGLNTKTRIVGGTISLPHEWTWMVALLRRGRFYCGGVIINNWYILTAAHCVMGINLKDLSVRLGEYDFNTHNNHQEDISISEIKRHAQFVSLTFQHDIALLKLKRSVQYSKFVGSICLPEDKARDFSDAQGTVVGWGTVSFGGAASPVLRQVTVPVWKNEECDRVYLLENINESFVCAGSTEKGEDACQGDSGGPLMTLNEQGRWEVIGIVSWGRRCGDPTYPGVYTRVTTYIDWIEENAV